MGQITNNALLNYPFGHWRCWTDIAFHQWQCRQTSQPVVFSMNHHSEYSHCTRAVPTSLVHWHWEVTSEMWYGVSACDLPMLQWLQHSRRRLSHLLHAKSFFKIGLHWISSPAKTESGHFSEIWPSPALVKFIDRFAECQCSCSMFSKLRIKLMQLTCQVVYPQF